MTADLAKIQAIVNQVGTDWKIKQALLRDMGLSETAIKQLVPDGGNPSDY